MLLFFQKVPAENEGAFCQEEPVLLQAGSRRSADRHSR